MRSLKRINPVHFILPAHALPGTDQVSAAVTLDFPDEGGHVGFVTGGPPGSLDWLPDRILRFFTEQE